MHLEDQDLQETSLSMKDQQVDQMIDQVAVMEEVQVVIDQLDHLVETEVAIDQVEDLQ